jgi:hypothetical protein
MKNKMKSSAHLFYGIITGIFLLACTGSLKEDKADFKEKRIIDMGLLGGSYIKKLDGWEPKEQTQNVLRNYKLNGWTIFNVFNNDAYIYAHIGR